MRALSRLTICGAFLMALLGSALGQNVQTDFDHQADFSQYKTYSWEAVQSASSLWDARIKNAVNAQLAAKGLTQADNGRAQADNGRTQADNSRTQANNSRTQANNSLPQLPNAPGFPFPPPPPPFAEARPETTFSCPTSAPCVAIVAIQTTETQKSLQGFYDGFGGGWGWGGFGNSGSLNITEHDYQEGTLVIDIYDGKTKQLLWRGSAEGTLSEKAVKDEKKLEKAVAKMFKDFPPSSTKR